MSQFPRIRNFFLIAALVFVLEAVFATAVAIQLNLSDPAIGAGTARDIWFTSGTALSAPGIFMIVYTVFLLLATRRGWVGVVGTVVVTLLTMVSALSLTADWGALQRAVEQNPGVMVALTVGSYFLATLAVIISGIATLFMQWRSRSRMAVASGSK